MLVVFVDRPSDDFTACFDVGSYGEIPLFNKNIFGYMKSSVYPLIDNDYVIFSLNPEAYKGEKYVFSTINDFYGFIVKNNQNNVAVFYLDACIEIDSDKIQCSEASADNIFLCDNNNVVFGFVFNKKDPKFNCDFCRSIIEKKHTDFERFILSDCVIKGKKLSNIKVYKELLNDMFRSEYYIDLPEIAQGIYSSGNIPSGDYIIVPPVYFGNDIQIETGAVIGPRTVIYDSSLVSRNSIVDNSVVMGNCYISKDCFLQNCICCSNVSVRRASSVLSGAVIGSNAMLSEKTNVEKDACIFEISGDRSCVERVLEKSDESVRKDIDDNIYEINNDRFNMKCEKVKGNLLKILLKTVSYEVAEEIISEIRTD